jgi:arsenate reductase
MKKEKVLFICTHNAARSQMAEGLLRNLHGDRYEVYSGGTEPSSISPFAIKVLAEIGIDISGHRSKSVKEFFKIKIDHVVTVCDNAKENCPFFPYGVNYYHESFQDPRAFEGTDEEKLNIFRRIRDEIREWINKTFGNLSNSIKK